MCHGASLHLVHLLWKFRQFLAKQKYCSLKIKFTMGVWVAALTFLDGDCSKSEENWFVLSKLLAGCFWTGFWLQWPTRYAGNEVFGRTAVLSKNIYNFVLKTILHLFACWRGSRDSACSLDKLDDGITGFCSASVDDRRLGCFFECLECLDLCRPFSPCFRFFES